MSLNASQLGKDMLTAFKGVLSDKWPDIKEYGEAESKKLAQTLVMIEALKLAGKINEEQAALHLDIQKNATRMVLLTLEGLGILMAEAAINAALNVVKDTVNTALGFVLL
ncbi:MULTISPECIES: hypothetical protein [unclassified Polaromonas]|jgi:hypothetical protein|uniref:hypothetical protein n=1 Tax=unclassified Polaromonas TaxID=2638319 RepID=UPI000BC67C2C|nr:MULTISPECIES: hypothetical protein [unclassified Polaromonas]OYY38571.1 MAG: hypothetical protein B7Y60_04870 [Polaromonas sp. 35-63-35]OYZ21271.1 MAG: hypothetical protein B7Y28_05335 [Polaromonas sp. 16-63-31]OYZ79029.1 MAG: hypothetical protein B7Y09_09455 [Polaromonas sp. 24-63-21]OZA50308.1 MAG: hypothetical protein B7X88_12295 [Polaromonas sp. 17-63-33]OZA89197.1 MAG: hypothetical protein B7X65_04290 [Polaromonas sp. 39-63-25]